MSGNTHHKHSHQDEADSYYDSKGNHVEFIIPYWWILLSSNKDSTVTIRVKQQKQLGGLQLPFPLNNPNTIGCCFTYRVGDKRLVIHTKRKLS